MKRIFSELKSLRYALLAFAATALLLGGCGGGGSSYDEPSSVDSAPIAGQSQNVLIDAPTLKSWVDAGYVNSDSFDNHVVILHNSGYADGHIPGAQEWAMGGVDRIDGPVLSGNMVLDGETMDRMLQERGIRENSTIVFTGGNNLARIYFNFRYWGFPKNQLKILNGDLAAWKAYGYPITNIAPNVQPSNCSVRDLPGPNTDVRASLSEAIIGVQEGTVVPYNTYSATAATTPKITETLDGVGPDALNAGMGGYVIFQGEMLGGVTDNMLAGLKKKVTIEGQEVTVFKDAAEMQTWLEGLGVDLSKDIMTYCRAGNLASQGFAPIDAVLGDKVKVMMYDGSWSQWGTLTSDPTVVPAGKLWVLPNGENGLPDYTEWATDIWMKPAPTYLIDYVGTITWNGADVTFDAAKHIQPPYFYEAPESPYDDGANTIEDEDREYWSSPAASGSAPTAVSGAAGGC